MVGVVWRGAVLITPGPSTEMGCALPNLGSPDPASASTIAGICMCLTPGKRTSRDQSPTSPWERRPESGRAQPPTPFPQGTVSSSSSQCVTQVLGEVGLAEGTAKFEKPHPEVQLNSWQVGTPVAPRRPQGTFPRVHW